MAVFEEIGDAKTIESFLTKKRLEARTYQEKFFRFFMFLHPPRPTYQVQVRHNGLKFAGELLDAGAPEALQWAIHCPTCNSRHVVYPQLTRPSVFSTIRMHLGLIFHLTEHECRCEHCHTRWHLAGEHVHSAREAAGHSPG